MSLFKNTTFSECNPKKNLLFWITFQKRRKIKERTSHSPFCIFKKHVDFDSAQSDIYFDSAQSDIFAQSDNNFSQAEPFEA